MEHSLLPAGLLTALTEWNAAYGPVISMAMGERLSPQTRSLIGGLDARAFRLCSAIERSVPEDARVEYFSEGLLCRLPHPSDADLGPRDTITFPGSHPHDPRGPGPCLPSPEEDAAVLSVEGNTEDLWFFTCEDHDEWSVPAVDVVDAADQRCPVDGTPAVLGSRFVPADRVVITLVPRALTTTGTHPHVRQEDLYSLAISSRDGRRRLTSLRTHPWAEASERARFFAGKTWDEAEKAWRHLRLDRPSTGR